MRVFWIDFSLVWIWFDSWRSCRTTCDSMEWLRLIYWRAINKNRHTTKSNFYCPSMSWLLLWILMFETIPMSPFNSKPPPQVLSVALQQFITTDAFFIGLLFWIFFRWFFRFCVYVCAKCVGKWWNYCQNVLSCRSINHIYCQ